MLGFKNKKVQSWSRLVGQATLPFNTCDSAHPIRSECLWPPGILTQLVAGAEQPNRRPYGSRESQDPSANGKALENQFLGCWAKQPDMATESLAGSELPEFESLLCSLLAVRLWIIAHPSFVLTPHL